MIRLTESVMHLKRWGQQIQRVRSSFVPSPHHRSVASCYTTTSLIHRHCSATISPTTSAHLHLRTVATWSSLGSAFNTCPEPKLHMRLGRQNIGLFEIPQLQDYTGFYLLQQQARAEADELVAEASSPNRCRKLVEVFDELSNCLCRVADMADFVRVAHPDRQFADAAEDACMSISSLVETLNTNTTIYYALKKVLADGDRFEMDAVDRRVAELFMFDFEQSGIHLSEEKRNSFVQLNDSILSLSTFFMQGCQRPVSVPRTELPPHLRDVFSMNGDNIMVTGLFSENPSELVREAAYKIYLYPDHQQMARLEALLLARFNMAQLAGFPTYAHRALRGTMGATPERVTEFLETLAESIRPHAEEDMKQLRQIKTNQGPWNNKLEAWDIAHCSGVARHNVCQLSNTELAPYLSLGACMEGLGRLFESLYGVTLHVLDTDRGELWSHDVHKLAVVHETEGTLGHIYCDFFDRPGKPHQDCHFTIQGGRRNSDGTYQRPVVVLMLNVPRPQSSVPSLLTPDMVENLFHEFGHAMHSMLGRTRYQHVTGTRCPTDFAEVPSVLMEYFAMDHRVLLSFARHWKTGEPLSLDTLHSVGRAKRMFSASETQLQVFYSLLDQVYHGVHPLPDQRDTMQTLEYVQNRYHCTPYVPGTAWHLRFGHFVGYGAKYYSYLMSRAVASRIWYQCFRSNPFSRDMGQRYRMRVLAHGGETNPTQLVENMLGERPTTQMLVQSLLDDLNDN